METAIIWFRQDLRIRDNPAWERAAAKGEAVIPLYIWSPEEGGPWSPGGASRWWLHHALADLAGQLKDLGLRLICRCGASEGELFRLVGETGARSVYWNRCYEPHRMRMDGRIKARLKEEGLEAWSGNAALLREPWEVATQAGKAYKVYTPYAKACAKRADPPPLASSGKPLAPGKWPESLSLDALGLLPGIGWHEGMAQFWNPSREAGLGRLKAFLQHRAGKYDGDRDIPCLDGTSRLSPYLHWGQIGPREVAAAIREQPDGKGYKTFHRELVWREFAYHVLYHFPDTPDSALQTKFRDFPWRRDPQLLRAWQCGKTGYPIVDAGMRQLWKTGWMHNRVRMIVASFLVKHLLHSWEEGARWFWDTLVDADLASNTLGWQWAGGCGADAAPYFRIFNPMTQSAKFDPDGKYIREYVPELKKVPDGHVHTPWEMPPDLQKTCGCVIGSDYPAPVIDHKEGRQRALAALESLRKGKG
ncbi:MAG: cryptochrome/photolyase family protein [Oceanipulchritudo sp.]